MVTDPRNAAVSDTARTGNMAPSAPAVSSGFYFYFTPETGRCGPPA